jgi:hypothetical protein
MINKKTMKKRWWFGTAFAFGTCGAACAVPIYLSLIGAGTVGSLFCTPKEALTVVGLSGLAAAGLFALRRRGRSSQCGDKADGSARPIACDLTVFSIRERIKHVALAKSLLAKARQVIEHDDGFTFVFEQSPGLEMKIADWVRSEKRCCPFFSFELTRTDAPPSIRLRISGPDGAKEILRAGFKNI